NLDTNVSGTSRISHKVYNAAGLVAYTVDTEGLVAKYRYDDSGRMVGQTLYAAPHTSGTINESGLNSWVSSNANSSVDRSTRTFYNARGDALYVVDAEGYVSLNNFDSKGRVNSTQLFHNPVTITDS